MKIEEIGIFSGRPDFDFTPVRRLEVKCEATNALMPAPTIDEASGRLRALAAKAGANAVIEVEYKSGVSFTSWKSLKATGLAVVRASEEVQCPVCAETIKRAALKCRFCGADRDMVSTPHVPATAAPMLNPQPLPEPLRENNNPAFIIGLIVLGLTVVGMLVSHM